MRWREDSVPGRGVRLHVRRVTDVDPVARPVLLLHGLGVGGVVWQAFARRLLPRLAGIAPDLRGHGQSDGPYEGYQPSDYAQDIVALLEHEGPMPIVGHSLGALVALETAAMRPDLAPWLALLDPPLDRTQRNPDIPEVYRLRHAPPGELEAYLLSVNPGGGAFLAQTLATLFRQANDAAFEAMLSRADVAVPRVEQPVLVLQADPRAGGVLGDAAAAHVRDQLPRVTLQKFVGAPHALHASHAAEVAAAIIEFDGYASGSSSDSR